MKNLKALAISVFLSFLPSLSRAAGPVILVNSAVGSDTQASGAGPATAIFGTAASFVGSVVSLDGSPSMNGVTIDSTTVLWMQTSIGRQFFTVISTAAAQVTVGQAPAGTATGRTWAIGGQRASVGAATSLLLFDNAGAAGDALAGWVIELQSGHTETLSAGFLMRGAGNTTDGPVIFRGKPNAAVKPILTFSNNGDAITVRNTSQWIQNMELRNSNITKTLSRAIFQASVPTDNVRLENITISSNTNNFWKGIVADISSALILNNNIGYTTSNGIENVSLSGNVGNCRIIGNFIHDISGSGIFMGANSYFGLLIERNVIYKPGSIGISVDNMRLDNLGGVTIINNTVDSPTSDAYKFLTAPSAGNQSFTLMNNIASNAGGYCYNFSAVGFTANYKDAQAMIISNNDSYLCTSGAYNPSSYGSNDPGLNPTFTNAAGGNFSIGTNLQAQGLPSVIGLSNTTSYIDIGAAQHNGSGGAAATTVYTFVQ